MNGHSRAFLLPEVYRLFPESEGVSGGVLKMYWELVRLQEAHLLE